MSRLIIVVGDQGCGKSRIARALANEFGLPVVDDWNGRSPLPVAAVVTTNVLDVEPWLGVLMVRVS